MSHPKGNEGASDFRRMAHSMLQAKYLRLLSIIWNVQPMQCIADYLVQATLDQLINSACSVVVVGAVVLILSLLSVVRAKPMEIPCSWPFHIIRSCIANELCLTHQMRRRMLLPHPSGGSYAPALVNRYMLVCVLRQQPAST